MKKLNVFQSIGLLSLAIIIGLCLGIISAKADERHNGHHETIINNYSIVNEYVNTNGLAAIFAATQIHPSENISGIQLGGGIAQVGSRVGIAGGVAITVPGRAMFNGSIAKEGNETFFGLGFNLSIKP